MELDPTDEFEQFHQTQEKHTFTRVTYINDEPMIFLDDKTVKEFG